jgi:hypothetical protein
MENTMIIHGYVGKSKPKKKPKPVREQYEQWLKNVMASKTSFSLDGKKTIKQVPLSPKPYRRETPYIPSSTFTGEACTKPIESKVYTGNNMIGIGTLHKSNAIPIFRDEDAKDMAKMRR